MRHFHASLLIVLLLGSIARGQSAPITLDVDASDAPRRILHSRMTIPAQPGKLTLLYPKWIPGEHGPTGPINDLVDLKMIAGGKTIAWTRDPVEMYAFHLDVPAGASSVEVTLDYLMPVAGERSGTERLADISWNRALLYPAGFKSSDLKYTATLRLPPGWKYGTALPAARESDQRIEFPTVSLETLVDSPVISGQYFRTFDLTPSSPTVHQLHIVGDSAEAVDAKPDYIAHYSRLCDEAEALFGAHHFRGYHFLLTLSDHVGFGGLEHHESSENSVDERSVIDEDSHKLFAALMPHEMTHSWNGKYRRPAGLATPDYQQPMQGELLWVYEGLTDYLGLVLAARSGLWTEEQFREDLALTAAGLDIQGGRNWRPLADTAVAAQELYHSPREGRARRRGTDFYPESALIWLEADVIIRQQSQGKKSLDDFCRRFHGGTSGPPQVVPYTLDDVVAALNETLPYDWKQFVKARIYDINPHAPMGGVEGGGWHLVFKDTRPEMLKSMEQKRKFTDMSYSLGFALKEDATIQDVIPNSLADKAGLAAGMQVIAVNGRKFSTEILRDALKAAKKDPAPIELLVDNHDYFKTFKLDYHDGERYPNLERDSAKPDLLSDVIKPLVPPPPAPATREAGTHQPAGG
ncbi:MAG TPA: PDZ domain-containing protein [Tepidisphaeraceae bacterium]|jgi:predicted metalloprotease with PDZ domain